MKALVGDFNQEKALVGAFSVIVQLHRLIDLRHYLICFVLAHKPHDRMPINVSILVPVIPFSFPPEVGSHKALVTMFAAVWLAGTPALKTPCTLITPLPSPFMPAPSNPGSAGGQVGHKCVGLPVRNGCEVSC